MAVTLDLPRIQQALRDDRLDGWLLYDFHDLNPIAQRLAGLEGRHTTRRWFYFIPATGTPRRLVHAVEPGVLDALPGETRVYSSRRDLETALADLLRGTSHLAMEYSPFGGIPYLGRVDAGTVELIRRLGPEVVSSGNLVGRFEAAWDAAALDTHRRASAALYRIKDRAFAHAASRLRTGAVVDEFGLQQEMVRWFEEEDLVTDAPPIVAVQEDAGNPHFSPEAGRSRRLGHGELLLLDLWGKLDVAGAVYADITWVGCAGNPSPEAAAAFGTIVEARDAGVTLVQSRVGAGQPIEGWEVDKAVREVVARAGFGPAFIHRTGHSLGQSVHGNGVNIDDYETHDDRRLLPGTAFTIEPGVYTPTFGVRTEINIVIGEQTAEVTGPRQMAIVRLE
jgi:Xaa-Pro aminopeptidase